MPNRKSTAVAHEAKGGGTIALSGDEALLLDQVLTYMLDHRLTDKRETKFRALRRRIVPLTDNPEWRPPLSR